MGLMTFFPCRVISQVTENTTILFIRWTRKSWDLELTGSSAPTILAKLQNKKALASRLITKARLRFQVLIRVDIAPFRGALTFIIHHFKYESCWLLVIIYANQKIMIGKSEITLRSGQIKLPSWNPRIPNPEDHLKFQTPESRMKYLLKNGKPPCGNSFQQSNHLQ